MLFAITGNCLSIINLNNHIAHPAVLERGEGGGGVLDLDKIHERAVLLAKYAYTLNLAKLFAFFFQVLFCYGLAKVANVQCAGGLDRLDWLRLRGIFGRRF